jgi:hypothetical protein
MNTNTREDRILDGWLSEGPSHGPAQGLQRSLAATRHAQQRPAWVFPRRWLPRRAAELEVRVPSFAVVGLLLGLALLLLLTFASFWAGRPTNHVRNYLGPSANGLIAFSDGNAVYTVTVDGTGRHAIGPSNDLARTAAFSPDGSHVAYVAASSVGSLAGTLVAIDVSGAGRVVLSGDIEVTKPKARGTANKLSSPRPKERIWLENRLLVLPCGNYTIFQSSWCEGWQRLTALALPRACVGDRAVYFHDLHSELSSDLQVDVEVYFHHPHSEFPSDFQVGVGGQLIIV